MGIIERSIRQPVAVTVVVLLVVIFGIIGLLRVPVQLTPNVDQPVITIETRWFGASPQEVAQEIVEEQEEVLKTTSGLREMASQSVEGQATVRLQFYVGVDKEAALNEVRDKLRQVPEYPADVDEPIVESVNSSSDDAIAWLVVRPAGGDYAAIERAMQNPNRAPGFDGDVTTLQDFLEDEVTPLLERVEGVARVQVYGGREREMQVRVDLAALASRGISIDRFNAALRGENLDVTAGTVYTGKRDVSVRAAAQYTDPQEVLDTVVAWTSAGAPVYVRDVAEVELGYKKQVGFVRSKGDDVVAVRVQRETGSNVLQVMQGLKVAIADINNVVLEPRNWGIELQQVYDQSIYVDQSVNQAADDLLIGAALAAIVLFLTLRSVGATMVVCVSIPISVVGTFLGMALTGRNLNVISMAGLSFAIGMGVDNTIVVLENIFRHREMGKDRFTAALDGAREVWGAIVAATLANIAVFLPVVFIQEEAGQLFQDISIAISISLVLYMVVSPTVIPMLATLFLRRMPAGLKESPSPVPQALSGNGDGQVNGERQVNGEDTTGQTRLGRLTAPFARAATGFSEAFYRFTFWMTGGVVRRLALVTLLIVLSVVASILLIPPQNYLPPGNQNFVFGLMFPPPGYNIEEMRKIGLGLEQTLRPWWEAEPGSPELAQLQEQWKFTLSNYALPGMEAQLEQMRVQRDQLVEQLKQVENAPMPAEQKQAAMEGLQSGIKGLEGGMAQFGEQLQTMRESVDVPPGAVENYFFVSFQGRVFMGGTAHDTSRVKQLATLMSSAINFPGTPGTPGFAFQVPIFRLGEALGTNVELALSGYDYDQVRSSAEMVQGLMMQKFSTFVQADPSNFNLGRPETRIVPDRVRAAAAGITTPAIREMTQVAVDGAILGDFRYAGQAIDLTVVAKGRDTRSGEGLADIPMAASEGRVVPLSTVANLIPTSAAQQINRLERQPSILLAVQLPRGTTVQEAQQNIEDILTPLREQGAIPPGITIKPKGSADKLQEFMAAFIPGFVLAAVITYLLLAALFESFLHPFVIIMSVPFALVGGFAGLAILHAVDRDALLDVLTMLGFVILIGTIVNNPILIVHQALNYIRGQGMERRRAIALSTQTRVRPIFMSVITSVAGMAPLVVLGGQGSELYRGLGAVVVGGLLLSTFFTLLLTPALMSLMLDLQAGVNHVFRRHHEPTPPGPNRAAEPVLTSN